MHLAPSPAGDRRRLAWGARPGLGSAAGGLCHVSIGTHGVWALCGPEQSRARLYRVPSSVFHVSSDLTGGDKNMRYALVIAMLLGSTLLAQAEPIDRDKWIAQTGRASKSCLAKFRQKFGEDKGHNYSHCVTDQTNKAIDDCVGSSEFSNCVLEKSLRVLEVCDLSSC